MSITFRNAATGSTANANTTPVSVTKPTGVVDGDVMLAFAAISSSTGAGAWTPPAGWTSIADTAVGLGSFACWYRVASSEGASYSWSSARTTAASVAIVAYAGASNTGIPDSSSGYASGGSTGSQVAPTTTTVADPATLIACWAGNGGSARTISSNPAGFTNRAVDTTRLGAQIFVDDEIGFTPAGATGTKTLVLSGSLGTASGAIIVSLAEAVAAIKGQPYYYQMLAAGNA